MSDRSIQEVSKDFKVTDRDLDEYLALVDLLPREIPEGAVVLNVGSGFRQTFENDLKQIRKDIKTVSIDPSAFIIGLKNYEGDGSSYRLDEEGTRQRRKFLAESSEGNTLSALGQKLPLKSGSIDVALDVYGPAYYGKTEDVFRDYVKEVVRVLKPGAKFYISSIRYGELDQKDIKIRKQEVEGILKNMGLKSRVYTHFDRDNGFGVWLVGATITIAK